jgi:exopolysaccharide biosynthesis protein
VDSGLSGGPRLIADGRIAVSDRGERLASSGLLPRTFVAYATQAGHPRYLVLGVATAMAFQDAAEFLEGYFHRFHGLPCAEAMSLDGGPSSQLTYRANGVLHEAQASDVTVPTSLLVFAGDATIKEAGLPSATSR